MSIAKPENLCYNVDTEERKVQADEKIKNGFDTIKDIPKSVCFAWSEWEEKVEHGGVTHLYRLSEK